MGDTGRRRLPRRIVIVVVAAQVLAGAALALVWRTAGAQVSFDVINGTANGGAAYVVYFNGKFPNFSPGIVGSTIPLSHTQIDNSPFSEATASPADTGPAGGTAVSAYNTTPPPVGPPTISQPQYAESRYPPGNAKPVTFGGAPGPYATAVSGADGARAGSGGVDTTATQNPSTAAMRSAFDAALLQWRARFMSPLTLLQHPATMADAAAPDGTDGDTSSSSAVLDLSNGLATTADARVQQASFGGGALVLHQVHTDVRIVNSGTPVAQITTALASASVGGVPVSIGADGVTVASGVVPLDQVQAASAQLNAVLASAGIKVSAVAPSVVRSEAEETVTATAISVVVSQPGPPEQTVRYNLGNVFVDNLAMPGTPSLGLGGSDLLGGVTAGSTLAPAQTSTEPLSPGAQVGAPPISGGGSTPRSSPQTASLQPAALHRPKPVWLLTAYLLWQALILATLASLWWWRNAARRLPTPGTPT